MPSWELAKNDGDRDERERERESTESVLLVHLDDEDDNDMSLFDIHPTSHQVGFDTRSSYCGVHKSRLMRCHH